MHVRQRLLVGVLFARGFGPIAPRPAEPPSLDDFLRSVIGLDDKRLADVHAGKTVTKVIERDPSRDVMVFGITAVHTPADSIEARLKDPRGMVALHPFEFGLIGEPPTLADLREIGIDSSEFRGLRKCKPNDCDFKLPVAAMRRFADSIDWKSPNAKAQVDSMARLDIQRFLIDYRTGGNTAMVHYDDAHGTPAGDAFADLLNHAAYLREYGPELRDYLASYPANRPSAARDVFYWSTERIPHLRPILTLTHAVAYTPADGPRLLVRKQIYANHYFEAALEVLAVIDAPSLPGGPGFYLLDIRQYRFDALPSGGFLNIRGRVRNRLGDVMKSDLEKERQR